MRKLFTVLFVLLFSIAFFCTSFAQNNRISNNGYADLKAPPFVQPRNPGIVDVDNRVISQDQKSNQTPIITNQQGMMPNAVVTIGTGPFISTSYDVSPYKTYWMDGQDQILYTAAELTAAGLGAGSITAFAFNVAVPDAATLNQFTISAQHTALTALTGFITTGWTQCYTGNVVAVAGWNTYTFSTNFNWNGTSNIVFKVCYNNTGYTNNSTVYYSNVPSTGVHYYFWGDLSTTSGCAQTTTSGTTYRPNVRITGAAGVSPTLSVNPSSLAFGYVPVGGTSAVKADTLRGANLTGFPSNIVVTAPAGFEVCLTLGGTYTSSVNVPYTSATLAATKIYSRFKPTLLQSYTGNITNAGGGATTVNVAVTGSAYLYAGYCTSNATDPADEDIFNVTVGTLNNSSTCATTGGIGSILNEYSNYTLSVAAPNIQAGGSIPFSVTSGTCGGAYGNAFKIFIDFNQNGSFLDAGEEVYVSPAAISGPHTETGNVSVPAGATLGNTMMRVVCVEISTPASITSCGTYSWGETEDYAVNVTAPPANDVGTFSVDISDLSYPGSMTPKATVKNFGTAAQTFNVTMVINPGAYTSTQTVTALASGLTQQVSFAGFTGAVGSYNVTVYTQLNPDANKTNDTLRKAINFSNGLWISGSAATVGTYLGTGVGYTRNDSGWVFSMGGNSTLGTEVIKYNVLANTYTTMASLPAKRVVSSSALLKDSIYVICGSTDGTNYLNTVVKYNINANTWSTLTSTVPALIGWGKAAGYQDSLIYCAGGLVSGVPVSSVYLYNANNNTWRSATSLPAARFGGAFAISGDTLIYVGGADASLLYATTYRGVISQTDRSIITWTAGTNYPGGTRYRFDAAPMGIGNGIMVAGGSPSTAWTGINDAYSYSPGLDKWTRRFNKTTAVLGASVGSVYIGNNNWRYAVISGYTGSATSTVTELFADTISTKPSFAPTLISPTSGSTGISVTPTLDWSDVGNTTNYGVQVSTENTFTTGIVVNTSGLATSQYVVPASTLANNTLYYWRARANNGAGSSGWSAAWNFTTVIPPPVAPVLLTPANLANIGTLTPAFSWNSSATATSYRLQVSSVSNFSTTLMDTTVLVTGPITIPASLLADNTVYYWRAAGINAGGTGSYSTAWSFTTKLAPVTPVLLAPVDAATGVSITPLLDWSTVIDKAGKEKSVIELNIKAPADNYRLQISTSNTFTTTVWDSAGITVSQVNVPAGKLLNSTLYYWRVNSTNAGGTSAWSAPFSFTTIIAAPIAPTLLLPANAGTGISLTPLADWGDVAGAVSYRLQISTSNTFTTTVWDSAGITVSQANVPAGKLLNNTLYYWRVNATNAGGTGSYSAIWSFTTIVSIPIAPVLATPLNNATGISLSPALTWNTVSGAVTYRVQVSTDSNFVTTQWDTTGVAVLTATVPAGKLSQTTKYYWRVNATNAGGTGGWSAKWNFTTLSLYLTLNLKVYLEGFWGGTTHVSDTVMVYLANALSPHAYVDTAKVVLSGTGTASMNFNRVTTGSYYVVVNHRNHLETWSKLPQSFTGGTPLSYDFTTAITQAFGDNMKQVGTAWVLYGGDANRDGSIDALDVVFVVNQFGTQGYLAADFNGDNDVTGADIALFVPNFGLTKIVPSVVMTPVIKTKDYDMTRIDSKKKVQSNTVKKTANRGIKQ